MLDNEPSAGVNVLPGIEPQDVILMQHKRVSVGDEALDLSARECAAAGHCVDGVFRRNGDKEVDVEFTKRTEARAQPSSTTTATFSIETEQSALKDTLPIYSNCSALLASSSSIVFGLACPYSTHPSCRLMVRG
jgi:hypothetical protein